MSASVEPQASERIIAMVLDVLEIDGYDAVQLQPVAKRAHVSLTTIYKFFGNRDGLIIAAVAAWPNAQGRAAEAALVVKAMRSKK